MLTLPKSVFPKVPAEAPQPGVKLKSGVGESVWVGVTVAVFVGVEVIVLVGVLVRMVPVLVGV